MSGATPEHSFARFQRTGDPEALAAVFRATAPKLLLLALHLTRDRAAADDLVQETFVAAIEAARVYEPDRGLLPWLAGILAHRARLLQRQRARQPDPARLRGGRGETPLASAEAGELAAQLALAVDALPPTYRDVLLLRLLHGLKSREIAHALGRSPHTVRTQLRRGLRQLRESLPKGLVPALAALEPGRGLAAIKAAVLQTLGVRAGAYAITLSPSAAPAAAAVVGGAVTVMAKKAVVFGVALAAVAAVLWNVRDRASGDRPSAEQPPPTVSPLQVPLAVETTPAPALQREPVEAPPEPSSTTGSLRVRLVWESDRSPAAGLHAKLIAWGAANARAHATTQRSDAEGVITWERVAAGQATIDVYRGGGCTLTVAPHALAEETISVPVGAQVDGLVVDELRTPVPGARIWLSAGGSFDDGVVETTADARGRFELRDVSGDRHIAARAAGHAPSHAYYLRLEPGGRTHVDIVFSGEGGSIRGVVLAPRGMPMGDAVVEVVPAPVPLQMTLEGRPRMWPPPFRLRTDGEGRFCADGIHAGTAVVRARAHGTGVAIARVAVEPHGVHEVQLDLPAAAAIEGRVTDADGAPVAQAWVLFADPNRDFSACVARSGTDGSYRLDEITPGDVEIRASDASLRATHRCTLAPGEQARVDLVLAPPTGSTRIQGVVVGADDRPLTGRLVVLVCDGMSWRAQAVTDESGRFSIGDCPDRPIDVQVHASAKAGVFPVAWFEAVQPAGGEIVVRVPAKHDQLARITARIVDADGNPIAKVPLSCTHDELPSGAGAWSDDRGRVVFEGLPPARYRVAVRGAEHPWVPLGEHDLAPEQTLDLGDVTIPRAGTIKAVVSEGPALRDLGIVLVFDARGEHAGVMVAEGNELRSGLLAPGGYEVRALANGAIARADVQVLADCETRVELRLRPGVLRQLVFRAADGREMRRLKVGVLDEDGRAVHAITLTRPTMIDGVFAFAPTLLPGRYRVEAASACGLRAEGELAIESLTPVSDPATFMLR